MDKILKEGIPLELVGSRFNLDDAGAQEKKMAASVHEVIDSSHIVLTNPLIRSRMIPMHKGERYNAFFFSNKIYQAPIVIRGNRREGTFHLVEAELTGTLQKYERREFFRLEVSVPLRYLVLSADNAKDFQEAVKNGSLLTMEGFKECTTLDISGGGIRFTAPDPIPQNSMIITHLVATTPAGKNRNYVFLGKLIRTGLLNGSRDIYDHRLQFVDMKREAREEFVHFIFEWERDRLKKRSGL